jgi:hypothetical protein
MHLATHLVMESGEEHTPSSQTPQWGPGGGDIPDSCPHAMTWLQVWSRSLVDLTRLAQMSALPGLKEHWSEDSSPKCFWSRAILGGMVPTGRHLHIDIMSEIYRLGLVNH